MIRLIKKDILRSDKSIVWILVGGKQFSITNANCTWQGDGGCLFTRSRWEERLLRILSQARVHHAKIYFRMKVCSIHFLNFSHFRSSGEDPFPASHSILILQNQTHCTQSALATNRWKDFKCLSSTHFPRTWYNSMQISPNWSSIITAHCIDSNVQTHFYSLNVVVTEYVFLYVRFKICRFLLGNNIWYVGEIFSDICWTFSYLHMWISFYNLWVISNECFVSSHVCKRSIL